MPDHKPKRSHVDLDVTPDMTASENIISLLEGLSTKMDVLNASVSINSSAIKDIDLRLTTKIDSLDSKVAESINQIKVDMDSRIHSLNTDINKRLEAIVTESQTSCDNMTKANEDFSAQLENAQYVYENRFDKLEKELLRYEMVVTGVPTTFGEVVFEIIGDICRALQCNVNGGDVVAAYRLPTSKTLPGRYRNGRQAAITAPIIVKLSSDWAKQELTSAYFKKKNLNTGDIGFQSAARIYLNESLTKHNREIFKAANEAKRAKSLWKCYTRNGTVHIQVREEGKTFRVNCLDQMNEIISNSASNPSNNGHNESNQPQPTATSSSPASIVKQTVQTTTPDLTNGKHNGVPMEG